MSAERSPVCVVTGVGPGNGAAFCRRFAREGYRVAMLARSAERLESLERDIPGTKGWSVDVTDAQSVAAVFAAIRTDLGPPEVLVHNAGSGVFGAFTDIDARTFEDAWRVNALGLFLCAREAVADMLPRERGNIVVIGATASLRGGAGFAAFAPAKAAARSLAQSMARSLGPRGIHVSHVVIDGVIDTPRTRSLLRDRDPSTFLQPDDIAETVWQLCRQPRTAWTFEIDLRPSVEKW